jgi:2-dehydropantoate 2-reductase
MSMSVDARRFVVVGGGAIGGTLAAELAIAGVPVTLVERSAELVDQVRRNGMRLTGIGGNRLARIDRVVLPEELEGPVEVAAVAVRSRDTDSALDALLPHLGEQSRVVSVQNGWNALHFAERLGVERALACMVHMSCKMTEPGTITKLGVGEFHIGEVDAMARPETKRVAEQMSRGIDTRATPNVWGYIWAKQIYAATMPTNALVDVPARELYAQDWAKYILLAVMLEGIQAADAEGIELESFERFDAAALRVERVEDLPRAMAALPKGSTKGNSGPYQSIKSGRRTEVDSLNGELVRIGRRHGLDMTINARIVELIKDIEEGRRAMDWANARGLGQPARAFVEQVVNA